LPPGGAPIKTAAAIAHYKREPLATLTNCASDSLIRVFPASMHDSVTEQFAEQQFDREMVPTRQDRLRASTEAQYEILHRGQGGR